MRKMRDMNELEKRKLQSGSKIRAAGKLTQVYQISKIFAYNCDSCIKLSVKCNWSEIKIVIVIKD